MTIEDRLRSTLRDMADEARPVDFLPRLDASVHRAGRPAVHRRTSLVLAAIVAAATVGTALMLRGEDASIEPVDRPPKVVRLADDSSPAPGRVHLAVILAFEAKHQDTAAYVLPANGERAVLLPASRRVPVAWTQHLSTDGTRLVRQYWDASNPRVEIVHLRTGRTDTIGGLKGFFPTLSPDNRTLAVDDADGGGLALVDVRSGSVDFLRGATEGGGYNAFSWSPDSTSLVVQRGAGSVILDRSGRVLQRLLGATVTNSSMSWSPDGRSILLYRKDPGAFVVAEIGNDGEAELTRPPGAVQPLGWAGSRVVWLAGLPGDQRLLTTDRQGHNPRLWTRLEVGDRTVESVSWARNLSTSRR